MISVIIPIYKAEMFLPRCLDSLKAQDYKEWEAILVDDGSPDNSGSICDSYAVDDSRFRVVHKVNGGVSSARNSGLNLAKGEWISFCDADDYLLPDYLSSMIGSKADMVLCGFTSPYGMNYCPESRFWDKSAIRKHLVQLMHNEYTIYVPWGKLIRRKIVEENNLFFNTKLRLSEDTIFVYNYLAYCNSVEFIHNQSYYYDGVPGGEKNKYALTWNEMIVMYMAQRKIRKKLADAFQYDGDLISWIDSKFFFVKDLRSSLTLSECYNRWLVDTKESFDTSFDYFVNNIVRVGDHFRNEINKEKKYSTSDLLQWQHFVDVQPSIVKIPSTHWRVIFKLSTTGYYTFAKLLIKLCSFVHKL